MDGRCQETPSFKIGKKSPADDFKLKVAKPPSPLSCMGLTVTRRSVVDAKMELISNCFDIRGFNKRCNFQGCTKAPDREALIMELNAKSQQRKELVSLYFCSKHFDICMKDLLNHLNKLCESGKNVYMETYDAGSR